ncbi:hypothetical protein GCM10025857_25450 [Alicyclobacillus contaminans]|nr:hypothetical protein GCM10025857_25450 [Alicyclobacillus contaminans]
MFFTYHYPWHALLIFGMTVVVYTLSLGIFRYRDALRRGDPLRWYQHPKLYMIAIIVFCVGTLSYYKYLKMAIASLNGLLHLADIHKTYAIPSMVVPLGISFFVFEFIHYAVDAYQGKAQRVNFFRFAVFIMYFPTLVSGPIKRYQIFVNQMFEMKRFRMEYLNEGLARILIGLGKKVIIADQMTPYAAPLLNPHAATAGQLWLAMYAYAMKIYFDFSGYSDIAIGSARLFGYQVPENFNFPYLQKNIATFWNNWHMSLSSWIRDYIYIPLGGNRGSVAFAARNSLIAMAISGLWHGAAWHFVLWGVYHGLGLVWMRYYGHWKKSGQAPEFLARVTIGTAGLKRPHIAGIRDVLSILATFQFVCFGWILFYCPSVHTAAYAVLKMFGIVGG